MFINPSNEFQRACMMFSLPEGLCILFTKSSIEMLPSLRPTDKSRICLTYSAVYPAASNSFADIFDILSAILCTDSVNISADNLPSLKPVFNAF